MQVFSKPLASWPLTRSSTEPALAAGRYRLGRSLGLGTLGEVFYAEDTQAVNQPVVAFKRLLPELVEDESALDELGREVTALERLNHPNIVQLLDYDLRPGQAYLVTEFMGGGTLAQLLHSEPGRPPLVFSLEQAVFYLRPLAAALDHIHACGLVHRDLKPQNILLDELGQPVLADFSVSASCNPRLPRRLSQAEAWGTPLYAAPEQWKEQAGPASDIYGLGCLLYRFITGYTPYEGEAQELIEQHQYAPVPRLSDAAPWLDYPPLLDRVIAAALAKSPYQRPRSAGELYRRYMVALAYSRSARPGAR